MRTVLPRSLRITLAAWLNERRSVRLLGNWAEGLICDLRDLDPKTYHKIIWSGHFDRYGRWYEPEFLFDSRRLNGSTRACREFFNDLAVVTDFLGLDARADIHSVLDVGCSVGHVLRLIETEKFPAAAELVGIDIDRQATRLGLRHLASAGSRVRLMCADMEDMDRLFGNRSFDLVYAAGSLNYVGGHDAATVVRQMLSRTNRLLAQVGLAHARVANHHLPRSLLSAEHGNTWIHNFSAMVAEAGGHVIQTRWEPPTAPDMEGLYFVFATPGRVRQAQELESPKSCAAV